MKVEPPAVRFHFITGRVDWSQSKALVGGCQCQYQCRYRWVYRNGDRNGDRRSEIGTDDDDGSVLEGYSDGVLELVTN